MSSVGGNCLIHGRFYGVVCPTCNSNSTPSPSIPIVPPQPQQPFTGYFAIVPRFVVTFTIPHKADIPARTETFMVSQDHLDAFIKILLLNGITQFDVKPSQTVT